MNHAFVSFDSTLEVSAIKTFISSLEKCNLRVVASSDTSTSTTLIDNSSLFICFVTMAYSKDDHCMTSIDYATQIGKPVLFLMHENVSGRDLDHLGYLLAGQENVLNVFEDREKSYLSGDGAQFVQIFTTLKKMLNIQLDMTKKDLETPFKYDLFITYEAEQYSRVQEFAEKLRNEKKLKVYYDESRFRTRATPAKYKQLQDSASVLVLVTKAFSAFTSCVEETSYAVRNKIPLNVIVDKEAEMKSELSQIIKQVPASDVTHDMAVLTDSTNPFVKNIESKIKLASKNVKRGVLALFGNMESIKMPVFKEQMTKQEPKIDDKTYKIPNNESKLNEKNNYPVDVDNLIKPESESTNEPSIENSMKDVTKEQISAEKDELDFNIKFQSQPKEYNDIPKQSVKSKK